MFRFVISLLALLGVLILPGVQASQDIWTEIPFSARGVEDSGRRFSADETALRSRLELSPHENLNDFSQQIQLPMPDGSLALFSIVESPIMKPGLAAKYPQIKTFKVYGIDDPLASGRVDITPQGFHAMLHTSMGRLFIDPQSEAAAPAVYHSRYRRGQPRQGFSCGVHQLDSSPVSPADLAARASHRIPGSLLEYDLAVAATAEYVAVVGPSIAQAQAAIVTAINRVNQVYEWDLGIRLTLVANNDQLLEDAGNVSFSNDNAFAMLNENQVWIDAQLGAGGYDIGHVFSTGGGGIAFLGSVCSATNKARGVTGQLNPVGDPFYIDFVAHEIGHQFNAQHSFNGTSGSCFGGNRNAASAWEPGSGSTIMGYAGICAVEDLQANSHATFHAGSIAQIDSFTAAAGNCFTPIATTPLNNADPVLAAVTAAIIPAQTPFALNASATDAESGTALYYTWDQMNAGSATNASSFGRDLGNNALFRSFDAQLGIGSRDFPALGTQVQGLFDDAEVMPCATRNLNFRVTARDNNSGQDTENVTLNVVNTAGPFAMTSQSANSTISFANTSFNVAWDVARTDLAPVNCPQVVIELLAFDDSLYTNYTVHQLLASTPNNGSAQVPVPSEWLQNPARGRIRVRCANNYFYALSKGDVQIVGDMPRIDFDDNDNATFFNNNGTTGAAAPFCDIGGPQIGDFFEETGGSGALDPRFGLLFVGLAALAIRRRRQGWQ